MKHIQATRLPEVELQRQYYTQTALVYDQAHPTQEHLLALYLLSAYIEYHNIQTILDIGAGTGRALQWLQQRFPQLKIIGIEPVAALREQGYAKGIPPNTLLAGDAYQLEFPDRSFDLVCEFGVLHHVKYPERVIQEMSRVAARMICISDCNFMGQGTWPVRQLKQVLLATGLWPLVVWLKTRGKGYFLSPGDGLAYSYSVFQNWATLQQCWKTLRLTTTKGMSDRPSNLALTADHLLLIGLDRRSP